MNRRLFLAAVVAAPIAPDVALRRESTIVIQGIDPNAMFTGRALRELMERLEEARLTPRTRPPTYV